MAHYDHILATTDFSERALAGVKEAAALAQELGAKVTLAYVVQDRLPPMMLGSGLHWQEIVESHKATALERLAAHAAEHLEGCDHETLVDVGVPSEVILRLSRRLAVDLIVMASHGYGLVGQIVLGSTTERVLRKAPCPVLVVHSTRG